MSNDAAYHITEDDYSGAMKLASKLTRKAALICAAVLLAFVLAAVFGRGLIQAAAIGGLIGGLSVGLGCRFLVNPFLTRRHYRKYKAIQEPISLSLEDRGIKFSSSDSVALLKWDQILKWRQNERYLLIYPMPRMYHIIVKTVADSGFDQGALEAELERRIGAPF